MSSSLKVKQAEENIISPGVAVVKFLNHCVNSTPWVSIMDGSVLTSSDEAGKI